MATVQEPRNRAKYETFLEDRLNRARNHVRFADLAVGALGLTALTLGFGLAMLALDRWLVLPLYARQLALVGFALAAGWYVLRVLLTPLRNPVNPYYAARQVEHALPEAKNSLVSWLDLRDRPLSEPIRDALGRKAAGDLGRVDVEEAVRDRRLALWGTMTGLLFVAAVAVFLALRPTQFLSLVARTFLPFATTHIAAQTHITLLDPAGDVTVPVNYSVPVRVEVDGRVPKPEADDAVRLRLRYNPEDGTWEERKLEATDRPGEWATRIPAAQVRTGFEFQVVGGDGATPIHRVKVRAKPLVTDFEVTYRFRPYLRYADEVRADPNLTAVRGTTVILLAKTNRPVSGGVLKYEATEAGPTVAPINAEVVADRPDTLKYTLVLERSGHYRLQFTAADGEPSEETLPFEIKVLPDQPPQVEMTKPAPPQIPVNGTLNVAGRATDDFGITAARLVLTLKTTANGKAEALPPIPYRGGKPLEYADGTRPRSADLKEVQALEKLTDIVGGKLELRAGMVLEYAFEAEDNCDNPKPQIGRSKVYTATLVEPQAPEERNADRQQAEDEKKEHDAKQDAEQQQKPDDGDPKNDQQNPINSPRAIRANNRR